MFIVTIADKMPSSVRSAMSTFRPDGACRFYVASNYKHFVPTGLAWAEAQRLSQSQVLRLTPSGFSIAYFCISLSANHQPVPQETND
ncbi:MAG: hypothetical protein V7641_4276 [Blastocatellia bacterium]